MYLFVMQDFENDSYDSILGEFKSCLAILTAPTHIYVHTNTHILIYTYPPPPHTHTHTCPPTPHTHNHTTCTHPSPLCTVSGKLKATLDSYREGAKAKHLGVVCKVKKKNIQYHSIQYLCLLVFSYPFPREGRVLCTCYSANQWPLQNYSKTRSWSSESGLRILVTSAIILTVKLGQFVVPVLWS